MSKISFLFRKNKKINQVNTKHPWSIIKTYNELWLSEVKNTTIFNKINKSGTKS